MKQKLKKAWQWLSGKKTGIGMAIMLTAQGVQLFLPNLMPAEQLDFIQTIGAVIGGFGLVHKGTKTETAQKLLHYKTKPSGK